MRRLILTAFLIFLAIGVSAQTDRRDVRAGNRKFHKDKVKEAEIDYRKAVVKDSLSVAGQYNLASSLYRQEDYEGASKALEAVKEVAPASDRASDYHYNVGDVALQKKDYAAAVEAFKQSLLLNPGDLDAKENYIYAKLMLQNQQNGGGDNNQDQDQDQNQNQNQNQDQDRNDDQNDDQNQDQNNDRDRNQPQPQEGGISQQQAQQILKAVQAQEQKTRDKVDKEKAEALQSKQKEKNW